MEKITKEELNNLMGGTPLSDDELEKVAGGFDVTLCVRSARVDKENCTSLCGSDNPPFSSNCWGKCEDIYDSQVSACNQN